MDRTASRRTAKQDVGSASEGSRRGHTRPQGLPLATRPATLSVVLLALTARREQGFRRTDLDSLSIPDRAYARGVLAFLDLLERSRPHRPKRALLEVRARAAARHDPKVIRSFLRHQFAEGCRRVIGPDFDPDSLGEMGLADLHSGDLDEVLDGLIDAALQSNPNLPGRDKRDKTTTCLKALHDAILHCDDPAWLAEEAGLSLDWLTEQLGVPAREACPWSSTGRPNRPVAARPQQDLRAPQPGPAATLPSVAGVTLFEAGSFRIAREADDRPVVARVYFERRENSSEADWLEQLGPEQASWYEQTALRLLDIADSLRRNAGPAGSDPTSEK